MNDTTTAINQMTPEALCARAAALRDAFRGRQDSAEANRQVPQESIDDLMNAGLYRVLQPGAFGGLECDLTTFFKVARIVSSGCGSTGWVYATSAQHQWMIGLFPHLAQQDVWGKNPRSIAAASFNPGNGVAVPDGTSYRLHGSWAYCSGIENCGWIILGVRVADSVNGEARHNGFVLVPKADLQIVDNWYVAGLEGTGSKDVMCDGIAVPKHRLLSLDDALSGSPPGADTNKGDLFRIPFFAAISLCLGAAVVGMAEGAVGEFIAHADAERARGAGAQLRVAEAAGLVDAAALLVSRDCDDITRTIAAGDALSETQRARNKGDLGYAARLSRRAVDLLFEAGGAAAVAAGGRVQRARRDIHAGAMHISLNWDAVGALYGRVALGQPAASAQF